jgi:hypothetical protein
VPVTSTLSSAASLLGGVIEDLAPPPLAPGENLGQAYRTGQRRRLWRRFLLEGAAFGAFGPFSWSLWVWFLGCGSVAYRVVDFPALGLLGFYSSLVFLFSFAIRALG